MKTLAYIYLGVAAVYFVKWNSKYNAGGTGTGQFLIKNALEWPLAFAQNPNQFLADLDLAAPRVLPG